MIAARGVIKGAWKALANVVDDLGMSKFLGMIICLVVGLIGIVLIIAITRYECVSKREKYKYDLEKKRLELEKMRAQHELEMDTPEERDKQRQHEENMQKIINEQQNTSERKISVLQTKNNSSGIS